MNTEDRFYFSKPGQPKRFARRDDLYRLLSRPVTISNRAEMGRLASEAVKQPDFTPNGQDMSLHDLANDVGIEIEALRSRASRPGQPERFLRIDPRSISRWESETRQKIDSIGPTVWIFVDPSGKEIWLPSPMRFREAVGWLTANQPKAKPNDYYKVAFSRPGQPDTFDASSLKRGDFAEASKSPILGKLLSDKAMPDGGWRAVQVGSDTLVISFEDADLATDFGRRVASKGYSATSPVATTGRYWNVEVKHG